MKLDDLLLTKEELPIIRETCFELPIHPALMLRNWGILYLNAAMKSIGDRFLEDDS